VKTLLHPTPTHKGHQEYSPDELHYHSAKPS
jgi:hypothetical protein